MAENPILNVLMNRASVRAYTDEMPSDEIIETIVRAGARAPFAMQMFSVIVRRAKNQPWGAPVGFLVCADIHRLSRIAKKRGWTVETNDLKLLLFAIQDAAYAAQNMVIAAEGLGLGSCYMGAPMGQAPKLVEECNLPPKVFPLVLLVAGYPAEKPEPRARFPLDFTMFSETYPDLTDEQVEEAMRTMDEGFLDAGYYAKGKLKLPVPEGREDRFTFEDYSWTEHICRKLQWSPEPEGMMESLRACGFEV
jgi:FMN reductase (NADPH)